MLLNCGAGEALEGLLDNRKVKPVHPEGNQPWIFIGLMLKLQYFGQLMRRTDSWKRPWCWERLKAGGEGGDRGWDVWMASSIQWTWVWASSQQLLGDGEGQGSPGCCIPWGHKELDRTYRLNSNNKTYASIHHYYYLGFTIWKDKLMLSSSSSQKQYECMHSTLQVMATWGFSLYTNQPHSRPPRHKV